MTIKSVHSLNKKKNKVCGQVLVVVSFYTQDNAVTPRSAVGAQNHLVKERAKFV